jgi:hypothetical protein
MIHILKPKLNILTEGLEDKHQPMLAHTHKSTMDKSNLHMHPNVTNTDGILLGTTEHWSKPNLAFILTITSLHNNYQRIQHIDT